MKRGRLFILYPHEVEAVRRFAKDCGVELSVKDDHSCCAQFVGRHDAFDTIGSHLYLPSRMIDDSLRQMLIRQEAGTLP